MTAGDKINIDKLARDLGFSNISIREPLFKLAVGGFVTVVPFKGMFVAEMNLQDIDEIFEIRDQLEQLAICKAAQHIPKDRLDQILRELNSLNNTNSNIETENVVYLMNEGLHSTILSVLSISCNDASSCLQEILYEEGSLLKRVGSVIHVKMEKLEKYKRLHANVWPEVLAMIASCNISNYSIYYKDGCLFSYFEHTGADMARMAADPATQHWWDMCNPCQEPLDTRAPGEWWAEMEEVFHF